MSLNFHLADIADYEALCWVDGPYGWKVVAPVTDALIHHTMSAGMGLITAANAEEFFARVAAAEERLGVTVAFNDPEKGIVERPLTLEDVRAHIGLRTNASPLNKTQFRQSLEARASS